MHTATEPEPRGRLTNLVVIDEAAEAPNAGGRCSDFDADCLDMSEEHVKSCVAGWLPSATMPGLPPADGYCLMER